MIFLATRRRYIDHLKAEMLVGSISSTERMAHWIALDNLAKRLEWRQLRMLARKQRVVAVGSEGGRYCLRADYGWAKVRVWKRTRIVDLHVAKFCVHANFPYRGHQVPWPDHVLALLMTISSDEPYFLEKANQIGSFPF